MLHNTIRRLTAIVNTCVPANFVFATDIAFYFPRFQPRTHLNPQGIPELSDAVALLQPANSESSLRWSKRDATNLEEWKKCRDKALMLLSRGEEILENVGGAKSSLVANIVRPLYATKFELLNGIEHLPRPACAQCVDVNRLILRQAGRLIFFNDTWDKGDVKQIDTACVILAHFVRSFCSLHQRQFHSNEETSGGKTKCIKKPLWSMVLDESNSTGENVLTLQLVMDRIEELLMLSRNAAEKHIERSPDLRWNVPKLLLLKGIMTIPLTGHLIQAQKCIDEAANIVYMFLKRKQPILDGLVARKHEPELGLFMLAQADMAARVFDWSVGVNEVDGNVLEMFEAAAKFYSSPYNTPLEADGIMSTNGLEERTFETDAYFSCMLSYGIFLLGAPRPQGALQRRDSPVFLPKQVFTMSPIATVVTSSDVIFADVQRRESMSVDVGRKRAGEAFERALQINRALYPDNRLNAKAGWTLLAMASLYADMRDYLYATGLFASAEKTLVENYGAVSLERLLLCKLRYEFLAGVGSADEAKAAGREVVHLLKQLDSIPQP